MYTNFVSLQSGRSGERVPVGARFSAPIQTVPGGPPNLLYSVYRVVPGWAVKLLGRGINHPPPSDPEVKEKVDQYLYSFLCLQERLWGDIYSNFVK